VNAQGVKKYSGQGQGYLILISLI